VFSWYSPKVSSFWLSSLLVREELEEAGVLRQIIKQVLAPLTLSLSLSPQGRGDLSGNALE